MKYADKWITCQERTCGKDFLLEAGWQEFMHKLELDGKVDKEGKPIVYCEPKRCPDCRAKRKNNIKRLSRDWGNA